MRDEADPGGESDWEGKPALGSDLDLGDESNSKGSSKGSLRSAKRGMLRTADVGLLPYDRYGNSLFLSRNGIVYFVRHDVVWHDGK